MSKYSLKIKAMVHMALQDRNNLHVFWRTILLFYSLGCNLAVLANLSITYIVS